MKRTLYMIAILALVAGCSDPRAEAPATTTPPAESPATATSPAESAQQPTASAKPTEAQKAEIAKKYGIEKPEKPHR